jgi:hypothetical protein
MPESRRRGVWSLRGEKSDRGNGGPEKPILACGAFFLSRLPPRPSVGHFGPSSVAVRGLAWGGADVYAGPMTRAWFALAVIALVLLTTSAPAPATQPRDPEVYVVRGGKVEITLAGGQIITQPRHGELSDVLQQSTGPGPQRPWQVTYTHGNDPDSTTDTFAFEVTDPSTGRRGRGRVVIRIVDSP